MDRRRAAPAGMGPMRQEGSRRMAKAKEPNMAKIAMSIPGELLRLVEA